MDSAELELEYLLVEHLLATADTAADGQATAEHSSRAHARLSASGTSRWWNCPGSVTLTADIPSTSSDYAVEGTAAHEVANLCLDGAMDAAEFIGRSMAIKSDGKSFVVPVTVDMAEAVQVYLDFCRTFRPEEGWEVYVERKFSLAKLRPPCAMFGTADFIAIHRERGIIAVADYKHGQGVSVKAEGNPQPKYYALGAWLELADGVPLEEVQMHIVQPRMRGGAIRSASMTPLALMEWSIELIERARYALDPGAPLQAGTWCRFCPASGRCPEEGNAALRTAQNEFDDSQPQPPAPEPSADVLDLLALMESGQAEVMPKPAQDPLPAKRTQPYPDLAEVAGAAPVEIRLLSKEQIGSILFRLDQLEEWAAAVRKAALDELQAGGTIPRWGLEPKRPGRYWRIEDEQQQAKRLAELYGIPVEKLFKRTLISPPQVEAVLAEMYREANGGTKKEASAIAKERLLGEWEPRSSGFNLAPMSDPTLALAGGEK